MTVRSDFLNRLMARIHGWGIDERLLAGQPADGDPVAAARLSRLLDPGYRATIAEGLRKMLGVARRRRLSPYLAQIPLRVREILEMEPLILTLARELEEEEHVSPRGVILADRLIRDGASPLYWRSDVDVVPRSADEVSVELAVRHARAALHLG
jgi:hypothetical protein